MSKSKLPQEAVAEDTSMEATFFYILKEGRIFLLHSAMDCSSHLHLELLKTKWKNHLENPYLTEWENNLNNCNHKGSLTDLKRDIPMTFEKIQKKLDSEEADPKMARLKQLEPIFSKLYGLFDKVLEFVEKAGKNKDFAKRKEYLEAAKFTLDVCNKVGLLCYDYRENRKMRGLTLSEANSPVLFTLDDFYTQAKDILSEKNPEIQTLSSHRGVKKILANILMNIFSLVYAAIKGGFFTPATDSKNRISALLQALEEVKKVNTPK